MFVHLCLSSGWFVSLNFQQVEDKVECRECACLEGKPLFYRLCRGAVGDEHEAHHQQACRHAEEEFFHYLAELNV